VDRDEAFKVFQETAGEVLDVDPSVITPEATLQELDIDSLAFVELTLALDDALDTKIPEPPSDLPMKTVGQAFDYVCGTLGI
jgi:acyl carrier protein